MSRFKTETLDGIEITRAKDVEKHGDHDQSSHGAWAHGVEVAPEIVRSTLDRVKENGGLSVSLKDGSEPTKGFMVAKGKKFAAIVKADDFFDEAKGAEILSSYMKQHKSEFKNSNNYLGLWHNTDDGQVYLDVSENIKDEGEAISRGRDRDQISIWDVANFKEIETGGTGGIEKTRSSRTARYVQHDGRADRRLRKRDLGEVSKTLKVIYFDYGLKPVFKHGEHDQSEHGNWARGYTAEEIARVEAMKELGPTVDDLDNVIKESGAYTQTDEQLKLIVENDQDLYNDATAGIDTIVEMRLANLQEEFPNHVYTEQEKSTIYENVQNEMIDGYIESQRDTLTELAAGMDSGEFDAVNPQELIDAFNDVYEVTHTGNNFDGDERTVSSKMIDAQIGYRGDGSIIIDGTIDNENGEQVGFIQREFFKENGVWNVEHLALVIEEDDYKGTGFGKEIIQNSEAWYVARGFGYIEVGTAMDGARHWARAGYDFNPEYLRENARALINSANDRFDEGTPERIEFDNLMGRYLDGYVPSSEPMYDGVRDMKDDGFPLPANFANIGYTPGAKEWAGKTLMASLNMKYVKVLTPEGQKLMDGPIDHDGDGLIYDGTSREKPAPSGGNK
jgi:GNAT superfamily N-acetyltransferase